MSKITDTDELYYYKFEFSNVILNKGAEKNHLYEKIYDLLVNNNLMDMRSVASSSIGIEFIEYESIGIVTFGEITSEIINKLRDIETYKGIIIFMDTVKYLCKIGIPANKTIMYITTLELDTQKHSICDCPCYKIITVPLVGLYKGLYMDVELAKKEKYDNYMNAGSWNCKSQLAITSLREIVSKKIRDIGLSCPYNNWCWSMGFGLDY